MSDAVRTPTERCHHKERNGLGINPYLFRTVVSYTAEERSLVGRVSKPKNFIFQF